MQATVSPHGGGLEPRSVTPPQERRSVVRGPLRWMRDRRRFPGYGPPLDDAAWRFRHRVVVAAAAAHVPVLAAAATLVDGTVWLALGAAFAATAALCGAALVAPTRTTGEALGTAAALSSTCAVVVVLQGNPAASLHPFLVLPLLWLYRSWLPALVAVGFVVVHHGVGGTIAARALFDHPAAVDHPWRWGVIEGLAVGIVSVAYFGIRRLDASERDTEVERITLLYGGAQSVIVRLEEAARMKDELVAILSHELRTPLTSILGFASLLSDGDAGTPEERRDWLVRLTRQGERLQFLLDNLQRSATIAIDPQARTELRTIVDEVVDEQRQRPIASGVALRSSIHAPYPVRISASALRLVVANLVVNAIRYAPAGSIVEIRAWTERSTGGSRSAFAVTNDAVAELTAADRDRMFGAFVQLGSSDGQSPPGGGLGLYIVRETISAHGGTVEVTTRGRRVTLTVRLPAAEDGATG